eukprot:CAMPEP_0116542080 /NCGR_PEP_ID=MMETSP0397-20121206/826_1 /TAXON_ID=216820 /ORGANISM="Cyclophora tenuis, Strain ECT3854" /LENGTH=261 /DNA_ID=CAMNT_0004066067 /DNA_START=41 /DNA_END=826 /DNA_ORIENTATION=-
MTHDGIQALADALANNANVHILHLWDNDINDEQAIILSHGLRHNRRLQQLHATRNRIGSSGANALIKAFSSCQRAVPMRVLDLSFNAINGEVAESLSEAALEKLSLDGNILSHQDTLAIAQALATNPPLHCLHLSRSNIQESGCRAIAEALRLNTNLRKLAMLRNPVGENNGMLETLRHYNRTLQDLSLDTPYMAKETVFWFQWNMEGRKMVAESNLPWSLWPHILARVSGHYHERSIVFGFLSSKPELMSLFGTHIQDVK